jgi:hypothetical protein
MQTGQMGAPRATLWIADWVSSIVIALLELQDIEPPMPQGRPPLPRRAATVRAAISAPQPASPVEAETECTTNGYIEVGGTTARRGAPHVGRSPHGTRSNGQNETCQSTT